MLPWTLNLLLGGAASTSLAYDSGSSNRTYYCVCDISFILCFTYILYTRAHTFKCILFWNKDYQISSVIYWQTFCSLICFSLMEFLLGNSFSFTLVCRLLLCMRLFFLFINQFQFYLLLLTFVNLWTICQSKELEIWESMEFVIFSFKVYLI